MGRRRNSKKIPREQKQNKRRKTRRKRDKYRRGCINKGAAAQSPDEWSDELMDAIKKAGWSVKEVATKNLKTSRRKKRGGIRSKSTNLSLLMLSWTPLSKIILGGQIKKEIALTK